MSEQHKEMWNQFADHYEKKLEKNATLSAGLLIALMDLEKASNVLEVGCGTGNAIPGIQKRLCVGCSFTATDFSEVFLDKARSKHPGVSFQLADNENLPFGNESFDRYISNLSLHIVNDASKMLQEAFRVLRPGGIAGFTVWGRNTKSNYFGILNKAAEDAGYHDDSRSHFYLNDDAELRRLITSAGFASVLTTYSTVGVNIKSGEELARMFHDMPGMLGLKSFSEEIYNSSLEKATAAANEVIRSGHALTFDILIAVGVKQ